MHSKTSLLSLLASAALFVAAPAFAQHDHHGAPAKPQQETKAGKLIPVAKKDAAWAAKARASYPLDVCLTSDEKLGSMGDAAEYIYRVAGQPDRLVLFCCAGCEEDFLQAPAKYLAKLDAAAKAKAKKRSS